MQNHKQQVFERVDFFPFTGICETLSTLWSLQWDVRVLNKAASCWNAFSPTDERWELHLSTAASTTAYVDSAVSQRDVIISLLRPWINWLNRDTREKPSDAPPTGLYHSAASSSSSPSSTTEEVGRSSHHRSIWSLPASVSTPASTLPHLAQQHILGTGASGRLPMVTAGQCCWRYSAARGVTERLITEGRGVVMNSSTRSLNKCTFSRKTSGESSSSTDEPNDTRSNCSSCRTQDCYQCSGTLVELKISVNWSINRKLMDSLLINCLCHIFSRNSRCFLVPAPSILFHFITEQNIFFTTFLLQIYIIFKNWLSVNPHNDNTFHEGGAPAAAGVQRPTNVSFPFVTCLCHQGSETIFVTLLWCKLTPWWTLTHTCSSFTLWMRGS